MKQFDKTILSTSIEPGEMLRESHVKFIREHLAKGFTHGEIAREFGVPVEDVRNFENAVGPHDLGYS